MENWVQRRQVRLIEIVQENPNRVVVVHYLDLSLPPFLGNKLLELLVSDSATPRWAKPSSLKCCNASDDERDESGENQEESNANSHRLILRFLFIGVNLATKHDHFTVPLISNSSCSCSCSSS
jgi:hypothetical protein